MSNADVRAFSRSLHSAGQDDGPWTDFNLRLCVLSSWRGARTATSLLGSRHPSPSLPSSPGGIVALLSEPETELKVFALRKLDEIVNDFWAEIADSLQAL